MHLKCNTFNSCLLDGFINIERTNNSSCTNFQSINTTLYSSTCMLKLWQRDLHLTFDNSFLNK